MSPPSILCLGGYYKGQRFIERCKEEGCTVYLFTTAELLSEAWPRHAIDEVFGSPDYLNRRAMLNTITYLSRTRRFDRVVALDDFDVEIAAHVREHLRMTDTGPGESIARLFRDKLAMRKRARDVGVRVPEFVGTFNDDAVRDFLGRVPGPWLVKPRSEASAAGIRKCHHPDDVWRRLEELGDDRSFHLVEQMVPGDLFHVDSLSADGVVIFAEVNAYWRPLLDVYQGGGIYATRTLPWDRPEVDALRRVNARLLEGFGLGWGASHTEFMRAHADGEFYFIETSARVGGAETATMVEAATGVNLWSEWARLEVCRTHGRYELPPLKQRYAGVVISLARQERPDTSAFTDPEIVHRVDMKNHVGFVVAADTPGRVEQLLSEYMDRIGREYHAVLPAADKVSH
jgi:hypothetical protein